MNLKEIEAEQTKLHEQAQRLFAPLYVVKYEDKRSDTELAYTTLEQALQKAKNMGQIFSRIEVYTKSHEITTV